MCSKRCLKRAGVGRSGGSCVFRGLHLSAEIIEYYCPGMIGTTLTNLQSGG
jgi:hypothetical protein